MKRLPVEPRDDWRTKIEYSGLIYSTSQKPTGEYVEYWHENAYYSLTYQEVTYLEQVTEELHRMSVEAARFLADGGLGFLSHDPEALELAKWSLELSQPSLYGRFDLSFDGNSHAKMLEYNADTPLSIIETSITQHHWAQDKFPGADQWNRLHEAFVKRWKFMQAKGMLKGDTVYFAHASDEKSGEDWLNTAYLRDTATQAGLHTMGINIQDVSWDTDALQFCGNYDEHIPVMFKLYPWEDLVNEEFGQHILDYPETTQWIEPAWKMFLSNKTLLAAMWHLYPNHENLLPSYLDGPNGMKEWIAKPLYGREGGGMIVNTEQENYKIPGAYGHEGYCWQQWNPLPDFDGNKAVIGSWVVGGKSVGAGIRESDGFITDYYARFLPNLIEG